MSTINSLKFALGSGASPSKYYLRIPVPLTLMGLSLGSNLIKKIPLVGDIISSGPTSTPDEESINILAKRTSIPEKTIGTTDIMHRGIKYVVRNVAEFPNRWDVTFHNTADLAMRRFFEEWMYQIHRFDNGIMPATLFMNNYFGTSSYNTGYMVNIEVAQLCQNGAKTANYEISYAFPVGISAVDLDDAKTNEVSEFTVTFAYSYWTAVANTSLTNIVEDKLGSVLGKIF